MEFLVTDYGTLEGVLRYDQYSNGQIRNIELREENTIVTSYGSLTPQFTDQGAIYERHKKYRSSLNLHDNGRLKSVALERQSVVKTPIGEYPAELVTFYKDGALNRVFPLNGQITGYWSEEDEGRMASEFPFNFKFASFSSKIISLRFYPSGQLKSITLWPGSTVTIETPIGPMVIRNGFALYEDGGLKSVEPAKPQLLTTKIGTFLSFDQDALGIHADENSLTFDPEGQLMSFVTSVNGIEVTLDEGQIVRVGPREAPSYVDVTEMMVVPIKVTFQGNQVMVNDGMKHIFDYEKASFRTYMSEYANRGGCTDCSTCTSCG